MKTALLVVSFGTTHLDTLEKNIARTEAAFRVAFPDFPLYRAFTSGIVRKRLKQNAGICVDSIEEALTRIRQDGFRRVLVQPTLLIPGEEYDKLCNAIRATAGDLEVRIGEPLLCRDADMEVMIALLEQAYALPRDTVLLLMGHGTEHSANAIYHRLSEKMEPHPMRLCTVEGTPTFGDAVDSLTAMPQKKVHLAPLMFVAGDHAKNDMAGSEPDSLRSMLEAQGFTVSWSIQGIGELEGVQQLYIEKAKAALR